MGGRLRTAHSTLRHLLPDPRVTGRQFIAGGRIIFTDEQDDEPVLAAEPDADELGLDPNLERDDE